MRIFRFLFQSMKVEGPSCYLEAFKTPICLLKVCGGFLLRLLLQVCFKHMRFLKMYYFYGNVAVAAGRNPSCPVISAMWMCSGNPYLHPSSLWTRSAGAGQRRGIERSAVVPLSLSVGGRFNCWSCSEESVTRSLLPPGTAQGGCESCSSQMLRCAAVATSVGQWHKFEADSPEVWDYR